MKLSELSHPILLPRSHYKPVALLLLSEGNNLQEVCVGRVRAVTCEYSEGIVVIRLHLTEGEKMIPTSTGSVVRSPEDYAILINPPWQDYDHRHIVVECDGMLTEIMVGHQNIQERLPRLCCGGMELVYPCILQKIMELEP